MKQFRIWYSDGEMSFGWLRAEGSHGRVGGIAKYDEEYALEQIELEQRARPDMAFSLIAVGATQDEENEIINRTREVARSRQRARWASQ
jgi:hypothetical protein